MAHVDRIVKKKEVTQSKWARRRKLEGKGKGNLKQRPQERSIFHESSSRCGLWDLGRNLWYQRGRAGKWSTESVQVYELDWVEK
jgi:hypothetical protein